MSMGATNYNGYTLEDALRSVGPGWSSLLHEVFTKLATLTNPIKIVQVKEKWGGLRIYTDLMDDEFDKFLIEIEKRSFRICETCGMPGKLRGRGWILTLCDEHADGRPVIEGGPDEDY